MPKNRVKRLYRDGDRWCKDCKGYKPLSEFNTKPSTNPRTPDARVPYSWCIKCHKTRKNRITKAGYERKYKSPENTAVNFSRRLVSHKLTTNDFEQLWKRANGCCEICGIPENQLPGRVGLRIDHCHKTGKVRGLLCNKHNSGMGHFEDNPELLKRAACYLIERA